MQTGWNENRALLRGTAAGSPVFSHENHGVAYDLFPLSVQRLSGAADRLNVVLPRSLLTACPVYEGLPLEVQGEVRSFNNRSGSGSRLVITVLARELAPTAEKPANHLALAGALCKPPILRRTPLGREICDLMLAVNRRYGSPGSELRPVVRGRSAPAGGPPSEPHLSKAGGRRPPGPHRL